MFGNKNLILAISIFVASLIIAGTLFYIHQERVLPPQEAAKKAIDYINQNILGEGLTASLLDVKEENGLYKFGLKIGESEYQFYVTKNGKLLFIEGIDLTQKLEAKKEVSSDITKREKPDVKIFVMSYCPFGLQAEKMFLPVYNLLKGKAEMGIYFVNYIMHGKRELDENLRQYCIQKEEENYYDYLSCFVKDGNFERCLLEAKIDKGKLENCISETDKKYNITKLYNDKSTWLNENFPKFDVHSDLNEKYGVRGSPTVVINDKVIEVNPRSPENFKNIICQAFNSQPEECSKELSKDVPSPGLGEGRGTSDGSCR